MGRQDEYPKTIDYIKLIFDTFVELHGDRKSGNDETFIAGLARLNSQKVVVLGYRVGEPSRVSPAGYRKFSRLAKLAAAFRKPVVVFLDAPIFPSLSVSEQQRINEAVSLNLEKMSCLTSPIIGIVLGGFGNVATVDTFAADRIIMLERTDPIVSSPDKVPSGRDANADSRLTARELVNLKKVDRTVKVSSKGNSEPVAKELRKTIIEELDKLRQIQQDDLVQQRLKKLQYQFLNPVTATVSTDELNNTI